MLLDDLKKFDWINEPENVRFNDFGMLVRAKYRTDFWNCARYDFQKNDGHFFFCKGEGDFCCDINWEFDVAKQFDQCGIMLRADDENWFKASIMYDNQTEPMLATSLTTAGFSDLATIALPTDTHRVWYRIKRRKDCYIASYSLDGENFSQLRKFYLLNEPEQPLVGAYICSPQRDDFEATLRGIEISE
jgi:regulation of enolase protein 1 (concanavalin A-like superfamily)